MRFGVVETRRKRPGCVEHELPIPVVEASTIEVSDELHPFRSKSKSIYQNPRALVAGFYLLVISDDSDQAPALACSLTAD